MLLNPYRFGLPVALPGLPAGIFPAGWWDSSDATSVDLVNTNQVSVWRDKSGNNHHLSAIGPNKHTYVSASQNGRNTVLGLNSAPAYYSMAGGGIAMDGAQGWAAVVFKPRFGSDGTMFFNHVSDPALFLLACSYAGAGATSPRKLYNYNPANGIQAGLAFESNETLFLGTKWGEGAGMYMGEQVGGVVGASPFSISQVLTYTTAPGSNGWFLDGEVCEMLVGTSNLTLAKFKELQAHLSAKWGLRGSYDTALSWVPGLQAWYDSSDPAVISAGDSTAAPVVVKIQDKSTAARHLTPVSTNKPTQRKAQQNGRNTVYALQTAAVNFAMEGAVLPLAGHGTIVVVYRPTSNGGVSGTIVLPGALSTDFYMAVSRSDALLYNSDSIPVAMPSTQFDGASMSLMASKWGEGAGMFIDARSNAEPGAGSKTIPGVLNYATGNWKLDGDLCELIITDQDLDFAQFNRLRDYLRQKWALNLSGFEVLIHFNGTHGAQPPLTFVEDAGKTVTRAGTALTLTTARTMFGPAALTGFTAGSTLQVPMTGVTGADWAVGCMFYWDGTSPAVNKALLTIGTSWELYLEGASGSKLSLYRGAGSILSGAVPSTNGWHFAVIERVGATVYLSLDGVLVANSAVAAFVDLPSGNLCVGSFADGTEPFAGGTVDQVFVKTDGNLYGGQAFAVPVSPLAAVYPQLPRWTPRHLSVQSGLWYNDDGSAGSPVNIWKDNSVNSRNAVQATPANQPVLVNAVQAKRRVTRFDGVNDYLTEPLPLANQVSTDQLSLYAVAKCTGAVGGTFTLLSTRPLSAAEGWTWRYNGPDTLCYFHTGKAPTLTLAIPSGRFNIVQANKNGLQVRLGVNGVVAAYQALAGFVSSGQGNTAIGSENAGTSSYFAGDMAEVVAVATIPSQAEEDKIVGYLAWRWGLQGNLPSTHPYKYEPPLQEPARALDALYTDLWMVGGINRLLSYYHGPLIRVRRSADNLEKDIGYVGSSLDTATLLAFAGAGSAFVTKIYDQTGNARHFSQPTAAFQARIVNAGVYDAMIRLDGVDDGYVSDKTTLATLALTFASKYVYRNLTAAFQWFMGNSNYSLAGHNAWILQYQTDVGSLVHYQYTGTAALSSKTGQPLTVAGVDMHLVDRTAAGVARTRRWINGVEQAVTAGSTTAQSGALTAEKLYLGFADAGDHASAMNLTHFAIWTSSQAANAVAINTALA